MAANSKISQLPSAAPIAGPELMECVQGAPTAKNVQTTAGQIINFVATNYALGGNPNAPAISASLGNQFSWWNFVPDASNQVAGATNVNTAAGWNFSGTNSLQEINSLGTTVGSSVRMQIMTTAAAANSAGEWYGSEFTTGGNGVFFMRVPASQFPIGGFTMTAYFALPTTLSTMQVFMGFSGGPSTTLGGSQVPSALTNVIALGKDAGDTTLQWMINNASGSCAKTPLAGATMAAIQGHLFRLSIICDGAGNVSMSLQDLELVNPINGGTAYTISFPTTTAKLPVAKSGGGNNQLNPHFHANNGAAGGVVAIGMNYASITGGFVAV